VTSARFHFVFKEQGWELALHARVFFSSSDETTRVRGIFEGVSAGRTIRAGADDFRLLVTSLSVIQRIKSKRGPQQYA
jgi:hypothetical protein